MGRYLDTCTMTSTVYLQRPKTRRGAVSHFLSERTPFPIARRRQFQLSRTFPKLRFLIPLNMAITITPRLAETSLPQCREHIKPRRCVSFDESRNKEYRNTRWTREEGKESWYSSFEYRRIKEEAQSQARKVWAKEKRISALDSYRNTMLRIYDACCQAQYEWSADALSPEDLALLIKFTVKSEMRCGLEKMCVREIMHDKFQRRHRVVGMVLAVQGKVSDGSEPQLEAIRVSSQRFSRASRLFARHIAVALQEANRQE